MEQRAVIRFFTLKGLNVQQIHSELESVYHKEALALPTVYKWSARFRIGRTTLSDEARHGRPGKSDLATGISAMLEVRPFLARKPIARHFRVAKTTCLRILRANLELKEFHLRWVPHTIAPTQKGNRVTLSRKLLTILFQEREKNFMDIMTGDESWFFLHDPHASAWAGSRDDLPVRIKPEIDAEKCLISVRWSVNGIHSPLDVPKGES
jgi:transposase